MSLCIRSGIEVTIANLFTESAYAPYLSSTSAEEITRIRLTEDESVLEILGPKSRMVDFKMKDAPLRLAISADQVIGRPISGHNRGDEVASVAERLRVLQEFDLVLLPLGIGEHVDHCLAREAGILSLLSARLAFYEDLPYASRIDDGRRAAYSANISSGGSDEFTPIVVRMAGGGKIKLDLASIYTSQISREVAIEIEEYANAMGEGERLYVHAGMVTRLEESLGIRKNGEGLPL